jgi:isocitrate dehydrogenase
MQASYNGIAVPTDGQAIEYSNGKFTVPDHPIIPFIEGDGTGRRHIGRRRTGCRTIP